MYGYFWTKKMTIIKHLLVYFTIYVRQYNYYDDNNNN